MCLKKTCTSRALFVYLLAILLTFLFCAATLAAVKDWETLYKQGKIDEAITSVRAAVDEKPKDPAARRWLGFLLLQKQDYAGALTQLQEARTLKSNSDELYLNMGMAYIGLNQSDKAIPELEQALALHKNWQAAHFNLGIAYFNTDQFDKSIEEYRKAEAAGAPNAALQNNLGLVLQKKGRKTEAVKMLRKATELDPKNA